MGYLKRMRAAVEIAERAETPEVPDTPPGVLPPARVEGTRVVTADTALTLSHVYRSVDILDTAVSQISCGVWRQGVEIDPAPSLVEKPDVNMPGAAFYGQTTVDLATTGNAFWRKHRTGPTDPVVALEIIAPAEIAVVRKRDSREVEYSYDGQTLQSWQVQHLKKMRRSGRLYGLGPIEASAAELRGGIDLRDYASEWFTSSGIPNGVLSTEQALSPSQAEQWKERAKDLFKPTEPAILGNGLKYAPIALRPADAQFLESRQFSVTEVARMFGIPAAYLLASVEGSSDTYSNQEQVDIWFVRYTLMSYLREIEMALTDLLPRGQAARFKIDALLRTDTKTRYEGHEIAIRAGLYSAEHAQKIEGLPAYTKPATAPAPVKESTDAP